MWQEIVLKAEEWLQRKDGPSGELVSDVEAARRHWLSTKAYFDSVTDPDLIDHAIYAMVAAERRYVYLLRTAKERGVSLPPSF